MPPSLVEEASLLGPGAGMFPSAGLPSISPQPPDLRAPGLAPTRGGTGTAPFDSHTSSRRSMGSCALGLQSRHVLRGAGSTCPLGSARSVSPASFDVL